MTENEVAQIIKAIKSLEDRVETNQLEHRRLIMGNGDPRAILPRLQKTESRLQKLEEFILGVPTWQRFGEKILTPALTAIITAGLMYAIFR